MNEKKKKKTALQSVLVCEKYSKYLGKFEIEKPPNISKPSFFQIYFVILYHFSPSLDKILHSLHPSSP